MFKIIRNLTAILITAIVFPTIAHAMTINVQTGSSSTYSGTAVAPDTGTTWNDIPGQSTTSYTLSSVLNSTGSTVSGLSVYVKPSCGVNA